MKINSLLLLLLIVSFGLQAQKDKDKMMQDLDLKANHYTQVAKQLWENPELGYLEEKSAALLQSELEKAGFKIEKGVAGMPTAFTATYGSGKPVIGVLGEFDALPGMSQEALPEKKARVDGAPGQACGHHLFGTGSMAAAISIKDWLANNKKTGTIRFYGTPAEEGGSGKVYMVRAGLFNDVDAVISWHAGDTNASNPSTNLATISGKFRFNGISSHAAAAPERGRSALDGVEAMDDMVNLMREHTTEGSRIHYIITKGGDAPNIVPANAEVYYVIRHQNREEVRSMWNRVIKAAEGAAMGTETKMEYEIIGGTYDRLPNESLQKVMHTNLTKVGGIKYTAEEIAFAEKIAKTLPGKVPSYKEAESIEPLHAEDGKASADTGDVSWTVPLVSMRAATWVPGTPPHSWQAVACGGTSIGYKGMVVAAKAMALTGIDLMSNPKMLDDAKKEFNERRGPGFNYEALLGDRKPALDYRK